MSKEAAYAYVQDELANLDPNAIEFRLLTKVHRAIMRTFSLNKDDANKVIGSYLSLIDSTIYGKWQALPKLNTAKQALAHFLNMDYAEAMEYEYHHGHFPHTVLAIGEEYFYAARNRNDAPDPDTYHWIEQFDSAVNGAGWRIFKVEAESNTLPQGEAAALDLRLKSLRSILGDAVPIDSENFKERYQQWFENAGFIYRRELRFCRNEEDPIKTLTR